MERKHFLDYFHCFIEKYITHIKCSQKNSKIIPRPPPHPPLDKQKLSRGKEIEQKTLLGWFSCIFLKMIKRPMNN